MVEIRPGINLYVRDGRTSLHADQAGECGRCHTMHHFFCNLCGRTVCLDCADAIARELIQSESVGAQG